YADGSLIFFPRQVAAVAGELLGRGLYVRQFIFASQRVFDDPLLHFLYSVPFPFPFQAFGRFVPLVASGSGMSLRLGYLFDMEQYRRMRLPDGTERCLEDLAHTRIVPGLHLIDIDAVGALSFLKPFQHFRDRTLRSLILTRDRDAIAVVPNENGQRHLQYTRRIQGLPEMAFARGCIPDRAKTNFITIIG